MPLHHSLKLTHNDAPLYNYLSYFFRVPSITVRAKCDRFDDVNIHTFRDRRSGNIVSVTDKIGFDNVKLNAYQRVENIAANISNPYNLIAEETYGGLTDVELFKSVVEHICKLPPHADRPFTKIPATKKPVEELGPNEVTVGRVTSMETLPTTGDDEPYYDLRFENNSGSYSCTAADIRRWTSNPLGKFVVFNDKRDVAIYHQNAFLRYFDVVESDNQISRPADLFAY